jgi:hypothetical protein
LIITFFLALRAEEEEKMHWGFFYDTTATATGFFSFVKIRLLGALVMKNTIVDFGSKRLRGYVRALSWYTKLGIEEQEPELPSYFTAFVPYETIDSLTVDLESDQVYWEWIPLNELGLPMSVQVCQETYGYRVKFLLLPTVRTARAFQMAQSPRDFADTLKSLGFYEIEGTMYERPRFISLEERRKMDEAYFASLPSDDEFYANIDNYFEPWPEWDLQGEALERAHETNKWIVKVKKSWKQAWALLLTNSITF